MKPNLTLAQQATLQEFPTIDINSIEDCPKCDGSGELQPDVQCKACKGTGIKNYEELTNPSTSFLLRQLRKHLEDNPDIAESLRQDFLKLTAVGEIPVCAMCGGTKGIGNGPTSFNPQPCPMCKNLKQALEDPIWVSHKIGDKYSMDGQSGWKIAYYPIFEDGKTGKKYDEPRALVEKPINGGTDFREIPLRYLRKV